LAQNAHAAKTQIGIVGMRVDARTIAADKLNEFVQSLGLPMVGYVRDTQNYIHLTAQGLTVFDVARARVEQDLELWQPICEWLEQR
jgi:chromosome partitioning protein